MAARRGAFPLICKVGRDLSSVACKLHPEGIQAQLWGCGGGSKWPVRTMNFHGLLWVQQQQALLPWVVIHSNCLVLFLGLIFSG